VVGVAVCLFLLSFKPFEFDNPELIYPYPLVSGIYGLIGTSWFYLVFAGGGKIAPTFFDDLNWTLKRELLMLFTIIFLIGLSNFLARELLINNEENFSLVYLIEEVSHTLLVSIFPTIILTLINFTILLQRNQQGASKLLKLLQRPHQFSNDIITIKSPITQDAIDLKIDELLFVSAQGNYLDIFVYHDLEVRRHIKRIPLKFLESHLQAFPNIIRTHRSYLVNLKYISSIEGNAMGYSLSLHHSDLTVPVSRSRIDFFKRAISGSS
jgi:hypothetical protein